MNRIEKVRECVDKMLITMPDSVARRGAYIHLYGVSQACSMLALKRNQNAELATIAGMLHDIYSYATMDTYEHAQKGAIMARGILNSLEIFTEDEVNSICNAIYNHSKKDGTHASFDEVLIDADVLQHCLYNPLFDVMEHEKRRYDKLKLEIGL